MDQVIQVVGALLILFGFAAAQAGWLRLDSRTYLALNLLGSAVLAHLAWHEEQWGFLLLEVVWAAVSLWSLVRVMRGLPVGGGGADGRQPPSSPPVEVSDASIRPARADDSTAMALIFREGIEDRVATFETEPASEAEMAALARSAAPVLVAERGGAVVAWAKVGPYADPHDYYAGVGEATLYVAREARGGGIGSALLAALAEAAERAGFHKLVGKIFASNVASVALVGRCGWSEVGVHRRHGRLDGEWRDVLVVEKLLGDASG